jgi:hypothetical protein
MKAPITFFIGLFVAILSTVQLVVTPSPVRVIGILVGLFFMFFGWVLGWTTHRRFTVLLGHLAMVIGSLLTAYAIYQLPSFKVAPTLLQVIDLPLFWGIFTMWGGYCMITHGHCSCCAKMHESGRMGATGTGSRETLK